jgi:hypothetical protein
MRLGISNAHKILFAGLFYLMCFAALTHPLLSRFSTHLFADEKDGLQGVWGMWWVDQSVRVLHKPPWWTDYMHHPHGVSLLGHQPLPFNGLAGIPLMRVLTLVEAHNFMLVFAFVVAGVNAFLLAYELTRSYVGSLVGGFVFSFSNYHFAHAEGHITLTSLEWLPLFALLWLRFITLPSVGRALAAALVLLMVLLCDYYYFAYCVVLGALLAGAHGFWCGDVFMLFRRGRRVALTAFVAAALVLAGPLPLSLLRLNQRDPLVGGHDPKRYSLDLLGLVIPGGHWRFSALTKPYWSKLPGNVHESSVHMGLSSAVIAFYVWKRRRLAAVPSLWQWYAAVAIFAVLALGPVIQVAGKPFPWAKTPYALLTVLVPPLELSGCPVRMVVMLTLALAVIWSAGLKLMLESPRGRLLAGPLLMMLVVEFLPAPIPTTRVEVPPIYGTLLTATAPGALADVVTPAALQLWLQTLHERPIAFGRLARTPRSVLEKDARIEAAIAEGRLGEIYCEHRIRYLIRSPLAADAAETAAPLYRDTKVALYDLAGGRRCR